MKLNTHGTGMTLGSFAALIHLVWLIFVGIGVAKPFVDWIMSLHLMQCTWSILPFAWGTAILLLIIAFVIGYIFGWVFAYIWNYFHK